MTTITLSYSWCSVYYECKNHAGDHDLCTIISTISNMIVSALPEGVMPDKYESGHVLIQRVMPERQLLEVVKTAEKVLRGLAEDNPKYILMI